MDLFLELKQLLAALEARGIDEAVWQGRQTVEFEGGLARVVSREGLIALKLAAARPQDIADVQKLMELGRG